MNPLLARGGTGFALEIGVVVVPLALLTFFARWNRHQQASKSEQPPRGE